MTDIQLLRNSYKIRLQNNVKDLENIIKHNIESIATLRSSDLPISFIEIRLDKIKLNNIEKQQKLTELHNKLLVIDNGELDSIIESEIVLNSTVKHKEKVIKFSATDILKSKEIYKNEQTENRQNKYYLKNTNSSLRYLEKTTDKMPTFMKNNLNDMPNNKGYIWKDIWFMGAKPAEPTNIRILFEKKYDQKDVLFIHEYSQTEYNLYRKVGKGRRELIESRRRIPKIF